MALDLDMLACRPVDAEHGQQKNAPINGNALMKIVLLAGGFGSRLSEETIVKPKPMVEIGGRPIILHIMELYARFGFKDFVIACGYKGEYIKNFFNNFHLNNSDYTISLQSGERTIVNPVAEDWRVSVVDTGLNTMTAGRVRKLRSWIGDDTFMLTYGDGLADVDLQALLRFHRAHGKIATVTAVQPPARFGSLKLDGAKVEDFAEKIHSQETWINGGFFVFEPGMFDYLTDLDTMPLEKEPLTNVARDGELMAFKHDGFWHPMDTMRDKEILEEMWADGEAPWKMAS
jgi:glucose-1-phosphate cytidylyltransferase